MGGGRGGVGLGGWIGGEVLPTVVTYACTAAAAAGSVERAMLAEFSTIFRPFFFLTVFSFFSASLHKHVTCTAPSYV